MDSVLNGRRIHRGDPWDYKYYGDFKSLNKSFLYILFLTTLLLIESLVLHHLENLSSEKTIERTIKQVLIGQGSGLDQNIEEKIRSQYKRTESPKIYYSHTEARKNPYQIITTILYERYDRENDLLLDIQYCTLVFTLKKEDFFQWVIIDAKVLDCPNQI